MVCLLVLILLDFENSIHSYKRSLGYNVVKMNVNQRRCPVPRCPASVRNKNFLRTEYENGSKDGINDCSHEDVVSSLEDDYLGDENIFEDKLKASKIYQSCLCFKLGSSSLTLVCTERKLKNNLVDFRIDFKIEKLFRIRNYKNCYCYVIISNLVPYWLTQSMGTFIQGVLKTRLIKNDNESGEFFWARLVCSIQVFALQSNSLSLTICQ